MTDSSDDAVIREATAADLEAVGRVWYEAAWDAGEETEPRRLIAVPSLYAHELANHELFVLETDNRVVAFASVIHRGDVAFLADLFVLTAFQSRRFGQRLLRHVLPPSPRTCCTVSSSDPRALPLYARYGMLPTWPGLPLFGDFGNLRLPTQPGVEVIEASLDDANFATWDEQLSGRRRPQDLAYWVQHRGGVPLWFAGRGATIGYGFAQTRSDDLLDNPDTITLGPIGVQNAQDATACVFSALQWARERGDRARISITGPHPALPALLEAGLRIVERETFCFRGDQPFIDPRRYISSGGDLF